MIKKAFWFAMVIVVIGAAALFLTAGGGKGSGGEEPSDTGDAPKFAVITSGPRDDNSWNEAAYLATKALEEKGVQTAFSERIAEGDEIRVLREYASQGFDMIVAHGFGYQDGVFEIAAEYPDINFAWAGGIGRTAKNVADYNQPFFEAAYPIGVIAGYMSETGKLGGLSGFEVPVCSLMEQSFLAGARSVNPDAQLISTATGTWEDVAASKEAALAQADAGVDFWISCGEGPALGSIEAAKEAGGFATGYVGDMTENGPDVVLINLIWNLEPLFDQMLQDTLDGTFDNPFYDFGVSEGAMLFTYNDDLKNMISAEARRAAEKALDGIRSGTIDLEALLME
jgi:simple sugar transport system substrate-binding protein/basic membrane protein A